MHRNLDQTPPWIYILIGVGVAVPLVVVLLLSLDRIFFPKEVRRPSVAQDALNADGVQLPAGDAGSNDASGQDSAAGWSQRLPRRSPTRPEDTDLSTPADPFALPPSGTEGVVSPAPVGNSASVPGSTASERPMAGGDKPVNPFETAEKEANSAPAHGQQTAGGSPAETPASPAETFAPPTPPGKLPPPTGKPIWGMPTTTFDPSATSSAGRTASSPTDAGRPHARSDEPRQRAKGPISLLSPQSLGAMAAVALVIIPIGSLISVPFLKLACKVCDEEVPDFGKAMVIEIQKNAVLFAINVAIIGLLGKELSPIGFPLALAVTTGMYTALLPTSIPKAIVIMVLEMVIAAALIAGVTVALVVLGVAVGLSLPR